MANNPLKFPSQEDEARIARYNFNDLLYKGKHYEAFNIKAKDPVEQRYKHLRYIVGNFSKIISNVMADMLFGENLGISVSDKKTQAFITSLVEENDLFSQLWEASVGASRRGDAVFKLRIGKKHPKDLKNSIIIEEFTPAIYFPELSINSTRNTPEKDIIAHTFKRDNITYLHKEIHEPGYIYHEVYKYNPDSKTLVSQEDVTQFGYVEQEATKIGRSLVFHTPNIRDGFGFWGSDDYDDLQSLFFALNNRLTSIDNILDKHSDPILAVPPGVLDEEGRIRKESLGMFEVENDNPGFNKPEYIVWNANLQAAENQIDKLIDMLYLFSEVSPSTMGTDKNGVAESGRALKFRMIATIRKKNRKMRQFDNTIKTMLKTAQELSIANNTPVAGNAPASPEMPTLKWSSKIISDDVEAVETEVKRVEAGIQSRKDAIVMLDNLPAEDAEKKVRDIDEESAPTIEPITNNINANQV